MYHEYAYAVFLAEACLMIDFESSYNRFLYFLALSRLTRCFCLAEQSDYFISPQTQEQVASAVFMIEEQSHATQDSDGVGMGVFFEPRRAVTADHNFPGEWQIGTHVVISFPGMPLICFSM